MLKCGNWTEIPITLDVVKRIIEIGQQEKAVKGLQFVDRNKTLMEHYTGDESNITGVYDEELEDEDDDSSYTTDNSNEESTIFSYDKFGDEDSDIMTVPEEEEEEENKFETESITRDAHDDTVSITRDAHGNASKNNLKSVVEELEGSIGNDNKEETPEESNRRAQCNRKKPELLSPASKGQYHKNKQYYNISNMGSKYSKAVQFLEERDVNTCFATTIRHLAFQQYGLKAGIKKFGERGVEATMSEMSQMHYRDSFKPVIPSDLDPIQKRKVLDSLAFIKEKRDGRVKTRMCADGRKQRIDEKKGENTSPTATTEAVIITSTIDAKEGRDVATMDIPNFLYKQGCQTRRKKT